MSKRGAQGNAITLMIGTLGSRVTGLVRNALLVQLFSKEITDAFITAFRVPNLFRELLAEGALTNAFVPIYKDLNREEGRKLSGAVFALLLLINALLLVVVVLAAPIIVNWLIADKANVNYDLAVQLTRVVFPFLAALSFSALAMGILQAEERFFAPAWAPVALNVTTIMLMLLYPQKAVPLAIAFVIGAVVQLLFQIPALLKWNVYPNFASFWHPSLGALLLLTIPSIFTTSGRQIVNVVASNLLTTISKGAVTAFWNADLFLSLVIGLFSVSPALAYYARLSDHAAKEKEAFQTTLLAGLKLISFLIVPAGFIMLLLADGAVQTVFNWTARVDTDVISLSVAALAPLGLAVFPIGLNNLLLRTFYARKKIRMPIIITLIYLGLQMSLYFYLVPRLGIAGLSWATVFAAWLQFFMYLSIVTLREKLDLEAFFSHSLRVWLAAGASALLMMFLLGQLSFPVTWLGFALKIGLGASILYLSYGLFCYVLRVEELKQFTSRFLKR